MCRSVPRHGVKSLVSLRLNEPAVSLTLQEPGATGYSNTWSRGLSLHVDSRALRPNDLRDNGERDPAHATGHLPASGGGKDHGSGLEAAATVAPGDPRPEGRSDGVEPPTVDRQPPRDASRPRNLDHKTVVSPEVVLARPDDAPRPPQDDPEPPVSMTGPARLAGRAVAVGETDRADRWRPGLARNTRRR